MSATLTHSTGRPSEPQTEGQDVLDEIVRGVHANGDALSISMDLLRRIIELLLPKAAGDGPTLSELLEALLATMRELLLVERSNASGIDEILSRLDAGGIGVAAQTSGTNGAHRP